MSEQHSALILEHTPRPLSKKEQRKLRKAEKQKLKEAKKEARAKEKAERRLEKLAKKDAKRLQKLEGKNQEVHNPAHIPSVGAVEEPHAPVDKKAEKVQYKQLKKEEKAEKKRIEEGRLTLYEQFESCSFVEIEELLLQAESREEKAFYRSLLNLKLQIEQEKVIGAVLL